MCLCVADVSLCMLLLISVCVLLLISACADISVSLMSLCVCVLSIQAKELQTEMLPHLLEEEPLIWELRKHFTRAEYTKTLAPALKTLPWWGLPKILRLVPDEKGVSVSVSVCLFVCLSVFVSVCAF